MTLFALSVLVASSLITGGFRSPSRLPPNPFDTLLYSTAGLYVKDTVHCSRSAIASHFGKGIFLTVGNSVDTCLRRVADLDSRAVHDVMAILNDTLTYRFPDLACFSPEIAILFLSPEGRIVGYVTVCMQCDKIKSDPEIPADNYYNFPAGDPEGKYFIHRTFGTKGKTALWRFFRKNGLVFPLELRGTEWRRHER